MATTSSYNIKQITSYDIGNNPSVDINITVPKRSNTKPYKIEDVVENVTYITALSNVSILKLGYCCEPKGIIYPIFLETNGSYKEIKIGKDGMYEMQPEEWTNVNDQDAERATTDVVITGVRVPAGVEFTLDYIVAIN